MRNPSRGKINLSVTAIAFAGAALAFTAGVIVFVLQTHDPDTRAWVLIALAMLATLGSALFGGAGVARESRAIELNQQVKSSGFSLFNAQVVLLVLGFIFPFLLMIFPGPASSDSISEVLKRLDQCEERVEEDASRIETLERRLTDLIGQRQGGGAPVPAPATAPD